MVKGSRLDFQLNVLPVSALTLSSVLGIMVIFSFRFLSDDENAVMSPPTWRSLLIPTPPLTTTAPVVLLVEFVVELTARVPDTVVASLVESPKVTLPSTSRVPLMSTLSLISTTPPVESSTRLPVDVSIVLSVVCAMWTLPNSTDPPLNLQDTI